MVKRPSVDYDPANNLLLFRLHYALANNEKLDNSFDNLSNILNVPMQLTKICASHLDKSGYCRIITNESLQEHPVTGNLSTYKEDCLEITAEGVEEVQEWTDDMFWEVARHSDLTLSEDDFETDEGALMDASEQNFVVGVSKLAGDDASLFDNAEAGIAPAADRYVSLDHNSKEFQTTVATIEKALEQIEKQNVPPPTEDGKKFAEIVQRVKSGFEYLKNPRGIVEINWINAALLSPFIWFSIKFSDSLAGKLAGEAAEAVKALFGL